MNAKYNLGSFNLKTKGNNVIPEMDISITDLSLEVTDISISDLTQLFKVLAAQNLSPKLSDSLPFNRNAKPAYPNG